MALLSWAIFSSRWPTIFWLCAIRCLPVRSGFARSRRPRRYPRTVSTNDRASIGFCRKPSQPTARLVSRLPSAVMATMGTRRNEGTDLSRSVTSYPSSPGMAISTNTRSGRDSRAKRIPSSPSAASITSMPAGANSLRTSSRFAGSSSMCSILGIVAGRLVSRGSDLV